MLLVYMFPPQHVDGLESLTMTMGFATTMRLFFFFRLGFFCFGIVTDYISSLMRATYTSLERDGGESPTRWGQRSNMEMIKNCLPILAVACELVLGPSSSSNHRARGRYTFC